MVPEWTTACPDWERRIVAGESLIPFAPLFPEEADAALDVFRDLRIKDLGPPPPTMGEVSRQWVLDFVASIFGAYDAATGHRLITEFFLLISKKNTKSTTAAGIMGTALVRNWRDAAEFLILAPTIEIANNSYVPARDMVRADPELSKLMHVADHQRTITHRLTGASLKVVAADAQTVSGKKAVGVLVDELWLLGKNPHAESMLREATGGLASRPEGFTIYLSTQSNEPPAGVFAQKLSYARQVRDGEVVDKRFLPVLYEYPKAMLAAKLERNAKHFYVTNPNLGASVLPEFLERGLAQATVAGEGSVRDFLAKHLNVEIGMVLMASAWAGARFWEEAVRDGGVSFDQLLKDSEVIVAGIDGGGLDDLMGLYLIGRERGTGRWIGWGKAWAHDTVLELRKDIATQLEGFQADGDLSIVATPGDDVAELADILETVNDLGLFPDENAIGVDPEGMAVILDELTNRGITVGAGAQVVGISQGWKMVGAMTETERRLKAKTLVHGGQKIMAWCVGNCREEPRGNARIITKQASGRAKIDPAMAMIDAAHLMALNPEAASNMPAIQTIAL
jgi:phage terminase large subunit-like protein